MRGLRWLLYAFPLSVLMMHGAVYAACKGCSEADVMCGPNCLLLVCEKLGVKADLQELTTLSGKDENGTTLLGLHDAATKKGLYASAVKIGLDELSGLKVPAIAHLWGDHFVVVEGTAGGDLTVTDPPAKPKQMSKADLGKMYSGFALLVAKEKEGLETAKATGPDLRLDEYSCDLGLIASDKPWTGKLKFNNAGDKDLIISGIRSSCDCLTATVSQINIPSGGSGEVTIVFDPKGLRDAQERTLTIQSNDPISPDVKIQVYAQIKPDLVIVSTRNIEFGTIKLGQGATETIRVTDPGDASLKLDKPLSDSPLITATLKGTPDTSKPGYEYQVLVSVKPEAPVGRIRGKVTLVTNNPKEPKVEIPVSVLVGGEITAYPDQFFLGLIKKGQTKDRSVTLSTSGKEPLKIGKIDSPFDYVTFKVAAEVEGKKYIITATLKETAPVGLIEGRVVIHTNSPDQPEITLPLYALVDDGS